MDLLIVFLTLKVLFQNDQSVLVNPLATASHECHSDGLVNKLLLI